MVEYGAGGDRLQGSTRLSRGWPHIRWPVAINLRAREAPRSSRSRSATMSPASAGERYQLCSAVVDAIIALTSGVVMAQVLVRNLPDDVVARLKARAARPRHSLEQELRLILIDAARAGREEVLADMDRIRAMTPNVPQTDSAELIREDRDLGWR
jgi:antitoxin FitA